jgi:hypothetical protein
MMQSLTVTAVEAERPKAYTPAALSMNREDAIITRAPSCALTPRAPLLRNVVSVTLRVPVPATCTPSPGRFAIKLFSITSLEAPVSDTPCVPGIAPATGPMNTLRSAIFRPAAVMLIAGPPPSATMLPTAPGTARIDTDLSMVNVAVL